MKSGKKCIVTNEGGKLGGAVAACRVGLKIGGHSAAMSAENIILRLARLTDAERIASMSRDLIETGLGWRWTPRRVAKNIRCKDTVTLLACEQKQIIAFAIMYFGQTEAHLNLLAVLPKHRRRGIGRRLLEWLEKSARVAGITAFSLEVRANNHVARRFYRALGFQETALLPLYYNGLESAIRMIRCLAGPPSQQGR